MDNLVIDLQRKMESAKKTFSKLKRGIYFGEYDSNVGLRKLASHSRNPESLTYLALAKGEGVRKEVAQNLNTPYEVLLYLLNDKKKDVIYSLLSNAKFLESDFLALVERFSHRPSNEAERKKVSMYLRLTPCDLQPQHYYERWQSSQSARIFFNPNITPRVLKEINFDSFSFGPSREPSMSILKGIQQAGVVNDFESSDFGLHWGDPEMPQEIKSSLPSSPFNDYYPNGATGKPLASELKAFDRFVQTQLNKSNHATKGTSESNSIAKPGISFVSDRELAKNPAIPIEYFHRLLQLGDDKTIKNALSNPSCPIEELAFWFRSFPMVCLDHPNFIFVIAEDPSFFKNTGLDTKKSLVRRKKDAPSFFIDALYQEYDDYIERNPGISSSLKTWSPTLIMIARHKMTSKSTLKKLYSRIYTDTTNISDKRKDIIAAVLAHPNFS